MSNTFTALDLVIFLISLLGVMAVGIYAGRHERTTQDYFLAGRRVRWWGVAGSIFGSNVSANHMVGMMGIGFTVGFAQSHFELGAIAGLMLLCYGFHPVYRKLNLYTLSEYLRQRYDDRSAIVYALLRGWTGMRQLDAVVHDVSVELGNRRDTIQVGGDHKMRLYLPSDHADLPWAGVLCSLAAVMMYYFY